MRPRWLAFVCTLILVTATLGAYRFKVEAWSHQDASYGIRTGSPGIATASHQRSLAILEGLEAAAIALASLAMGSLVFLLSRRDGRESWALIGLISAGVCVSYLFTLAISVMDCSVEEQRRHALAFTLCPISVGGSLWGAAGAGLTSRDWGGKALGGVAMLGALAWSALGILEHFF